MRTHTRLILINLVGLVFTMAGVASLIALENWYEVDRRRWRDQVEEKRLALRDVRGAVGYGGMIHALKNYVLRREPQYVRQFDAGVASAREAIGRFRAAEDVSEKERADLALIEEMIGRYEAAMARSVGSEEETRELDAIIRIDDTPYIRAFDRLQTGIDARAAEMAEEIERNLALGRLVGVGGGIVGAGLVMGLGSLLAIRAGRRLDRESRERVRALVELEQSRQHSQFLANMSHEIRTPLNAVLGYAQLAQDPGLSPADRAAHLETVRRNGRYLMDLVNSVLDLSKIEAGRLGIVPVEADPREVVEEVLSLVGVPAHEKKLRVRVEYENIVPERVRVDALRMRQILVNLVGNAVKFTEEGEILVRVSFEPFGEREGELRVAVRDTGIGIDAADMEMIFGSFEQVDPSMTRRFGGTGLGLHISRRLAQMMGGDIAARSSPGAGSEFTAHFPVEVVELHARARRESHIEARGLRGNELEDVRILVVEDGEDNQRLIKHFLTKSGAAVETALDGVEAIAKISSLGTFDLVLMDMQMPNMDGYEATRRLRESGYDAPIVALTAHAMSDDRERCLAAGCDEYATKPIDRAHLVTLCVRLIKGGPARGQAAG
ncbi:MAG: ATP-binding protein [Phycisphaerales bacterium]